MLVIIHIIIVLIALSIVLKADHYGYTWMSGQESVLSEQKLSRLHTYTWVAILAVVTTGAILFLQDAEYLLSSRAFLIKMAFVGTLVVNSFSIGILKETATKSKFSDLLLKEKIPLFIAGGTSTLCWLGALTCAFFLD